MVKALCLGSLEDLIRSSKERGFEPLSSQYRFCFSLTIWMSGSLQIPFLRIEIGRCKLSDNTVFATRKTC